MACGGKQSQQRVRASLSTKASTSVTLFRPLFKVKASEVESLRMDVCLVTKTANIKVKRAWRGSNDGGNTWSAVTEFGSYVSTGGWVIGANLGAVDDTYELVEYGLTCVNTSGTNVEQAQVHVVSNQRAL